MAIRNTKRYIATLASLAVAGVALTGCTINIGTPFPNSSNDSTGMMDHDEMGKNMMGSSAATDSGFAAQDIMFAQMMIPHHEQAVLMSNLALKTSTNSEVLALAKTIKAAQQPEINQMQQWITKAGASQTMGHDMGMNGMLSNEEINALSAASGTAFDKLFLAGMIQHHQSAIQMAQMVASSKNAEAKALGNAIVTSQTAEIAHMQELLKKLN